MVCYKDFSPSRDAFPSFAKIYLQAGLCSDRTARSLRIIELISGNRTPLPEYQGGR
jgi:hypothetical protein